MRNACVQDDIVRWIDAYEAKQSLFTLRSQLTELECFVFKEYFLQQRQASEIAEERHISVTAVYGAIQRIRKKACRFLWTVPRPADKKICACRSISRNYTALLLFS